MLFSSPRQTRVLRHLGERRIGVRNEFSALRGWMGGGGEKENEDQNELQGDGTIIKRRDRCVTRHSQISLRPLHMIYG